MHLLTFGAVAMFCHQRLAADRPDSAHLTEFYLWMSIGGVVGGLCNALLAPVLLTTIFEYPLAMLLASMVRETRAEDEVHPLLSQEAGRLRSDSVRDGVGARLLRHELSA